MLSCASEHRVPELMSPAGDFDAMRAAVANGADAVYFGLDNFNARHRAANFTLTELPQIMRYLHGHNVKGFLTFNTLIFSDELSDAVDYIRQIAAAGVDALIVQDLGLARLIHELAPGLPIHGSTQMTLTEPRGIEFVRRLGVQRVVLARELSIDDIRRIKSATTMELEVFIHGALCVAYSGQCLTSESLGGRSANRGQCAQACRLPYELMVDGAPRNLGDRAYLLSPQDLAAYDLVGALSELGVACLKIEGRLKSAHYVAATTQTYRGALDAARTDRRFVLGPQQRADLEQTFSRGFTHGFLSGVNHQDLVAARFPKSRGLRVGTVEQILSKSLVIEVESNVALNKGDGVVFDEGHPEQDEQGGRIFAVRPRGKTLIEIELGRGDVNLSAIAAGAIVWKTDDPALRKRLEHTFSRDTVVRRSRLSAVVRAHVGNNLSISFYDGDERVEVAWDKPLEPAQKFPLRESLLRQQLGRLGDTPYELAEVTLDAAGDPMVPKSVLNELRRQAIALLMQKRSQRQTASVACPGALEQLRAKLPLRRSSVDQPRLYVLARSLEQLNSVLSWKSSAGPAMVYCDFEDIRRYGDAVALAHSAAVPIGLATLRIVKPHEHGVLQQILDCQPDAVLVRNLAAVSFYHQAWPQLPQIGDYSLNISNELTAGIFAETGLVRMVPSYDLSWRQLASMLGRFDPSRFECVIHQHMPMFHMEHCVFAHTLSNGKDYRDCGRPCEKHQVDLRDRVGQPHPLIPDVGCRNTVFNAQAQSAAQYVPKMLELGIRHYRIELLREKAHEVAPLLDRYADVIRGRFEPKAALRSLRVLNQLGVTSGTLERE
jgi:putative protease